MYIWFLGKKDYVAFCRGLGGDKGTSRLKTFRWFSQEAEVRTNSGLILIRKVKGMRSMWKLRGRGFNWGLEKEALP